MQGQISLVLFSYWVWFSSDRLRFELFWRLVSTNEDLCPSSWIKRIVQNVFTSLFNVFASKLFYDPFFLDIYRIDTFFKTKWVGLYIYTWSILYSTTFLFQNLLGKFTKMHSIYFSENLDQIKMFHFRIKIRQEHSWCTCMHHGSSQEKLLTTNSEVLFEEIESLTRSKGDSEIPLRDIQAMFDRLAFDLQNKYKYPQKM